MEYKILEVVERNLNNGRSNELLLFVTIDAGNGMEKTYYGLHNGTDTAIQDIPRYGPKCTRNPDGSFQISNFTF